MSAHESAAAHRFGRHHIGCISSRRAKLGARRPLREVDDLERQAFVCCLNGVPDPCCGERTQLVCRSTPLILSHQRRVPYACGRRCVRDDRRSAELGTSGRSSLDQRIVADRARGVLDRSMHACARAHAPEPCACVGSYAVTVRSSTATCVSSGGTRSSGRRRRRARRRGEQLDDGRADGDGSRVAERTASPIAIRDLQAWTPVSSRRGRMR